MKALIAIIILALVTLGIYFMVKNPGPQVKENKEVQKVQVTPTTTPENTIYKPKTVTVTYTSAGYNPKEVNIKAGDTVQFVNQSSGSMWPASAMHPTHEVYDGTNLTTHCAPRATPSLESELAPFDACKNIMVGGSYSFIFRNVGTWKYHDHTTPNFMGSVTVE